MINGGLKFDLRKKDYAIKIQWIKHLRQKKEAANLAYYFLPNTCIGKRYGNVI